MGNRPLSECVFPFPSLPWIEDAPERERVYVAIIDSLMERFPEGARFVRADLLIRSGKPPRFEVSEPVPGELCLTIRRKEWGS